jgi:hypothetical protein
MKSKNKKQKSFNSSFFKKSNKGDLLSEKTLTVVIALICIIFLFILATSIYFALTGASNIKAAEVSKDKIVQEVNRINNSGETNLEGIQIQNPAGWSIFSFVGDKKPNLCAGENCLCICERLAIGIVNVDSRIAQKCDDKGTCFVVPNLNHFDEIKIENGGIFISIQKINNEIQIAKK